MNSFEEMIFLATICPCSSPEKRKDGYCRTCARIVRKNPSCLMCEAKNDKEFLYVSWKYQTSFCQECFFALPEFIEEKIANKKNLERSKSSRTVNSRRSHQRKKSQSQSDISQYEILKKRKRRRRRTTSNKN